MLSRLLLMLVQLAAGWYGGRALMAHVPDLKKLNLFVAAAIMTLIVWGIGAIASAALKDVARPSPVSFVYTLGAALVMAIIPFIPEAERAVVSVAGALPYLAYPLIGAVIGYAIQR